MSNGVQRAFQGILRLLWAACHKCSPRGGLCWVLPARLAERVTARGAAQVQSIGPDLTCIPPAGFAFAQAAADGIRPDPDGASSGAPPKLSAMALRLLRHPSLTARRIELLSPTELRALDCIDGDQNLDSGPLPVLVRHGLVVTGLGRVVGALREGGGTCVPVINLDRLTESEALAYLELDEALRALPHLASAELSELARACAARGRRAQEDGT